MKFAEKIAHPNTNLNNRQRDCWIQEYSTVASDGKGDGVQQDVRFTRAKQSFCGIYDFF